MNAENRPHIDMAAINFPHSLEVDRIYEVLVTGRNGLSDVEVNERLTTFGQNKLDEKSGYSIWKLIIGQFTGFLVLLLIGAGILSIAIGEVIDAIAIFSILIVNGVLGFVQEFKAERSLEALKKIEVLHAQVLRNGMETTILASQIVPGDMVILSEGKKIPADGRLIESHTLMIDESMLTGESIPVNKNTDLMAEKTVVADRKNMVFSGSLVTKGRGLAVVVNTGTKTELGKIATEINSALDEDTPLQKAMGRLGKILGIVSLCAIIPGLIAGVIGDYDLTEVILVAISLAVSAIPEGLPIVVTIALALGIRRMADVDVLIRRLSTAETLGGTDVICSDKTGTITHNEMTVTRIFIPRVGFFDISGQGYSADGEIVFDKSGTGEVELPAGIGDARELVKALLQEGVLSSDASLEHGDPTERALVAVLRKSGIDEIGLKKANPRLDEIPFDSEQRFMAVTVQTGSYKRAIIKGAPGRIYEMCNFGLPEEREKISQVDDMFSAKGLRVLAVAHKEIETESQMSDLSGYNLIGLVAMEDPPRESVIGAVKAVHDAGVRVMMLTGDHRLTAQSIAMQVGLVEPGKENQVVTGAEIDEMNEQEFLDVVKRVNVYARVSPHHKLRVLTALQEMGLEVAMTGDGVNDAPAVKRADIGIAVGAGTDLTKGVSDMILLDNDFASIEEGIREGRRIFYNIKKFVRLIVSSNFDEIALIFTALVFKMPLPLLPLQILWLNLVTDSLPALALTSDVADPAAMKDPPYDPKKEIVNGILPFTLLASTIAYLASLSVFLLTYYGWGWQIAEARTMVFTTTVFFEYFLAYSIRSTKSAFSIGIFSNKFLLISILIGVIGQVFIIYHPLGQSVFGTFPLKAVDWLLVIGFASSGFVIIEVLKSIKQKFPNSIGRLIPIH